MHYLIILSLPLDLFNRHHFSPHNLNLIMYNSHIPLIFTFTLFGELKLSRQDSLYTHTHNGKVLSIFLNIYIYIFFFLLRFAAAAYGSSWARGPIGAAVYTTDSAVGDQSRICSPQCISTTER